MPVARVRTCWYGVFGKELFSDCSVRAPSCVPDRIAESLYAYLPARRAARIDPIEALRAKSGTQQTGRDKAAHHEQVGVSGN